LANAELAAGNFSQAETHYRQMLANQPNNLIAANNLALALAQQGKHAQAAQQIDRVIRQVDADDPLKSEFLDTQQEIEQMFSIQD
jgi:Flp pilus assembly protein TadD